MQFLYILFDIKQLYINNDVASNHIIEIDYLISSIININIENCSFYCHKRIEDILVEEEAGEEGEDKENIMDTVIASEPLLHGFITKTLRVTTKDTRMFVGELKCTDRVGVPIPTSYS